MSYIIPESNLKISEFNRFVKDLNGLTIDEFLIELDKSYRIEEKGERFYKPSQKHHFSMYLDGKFYSLYLRKSAYTYKDALLWCPSAMYRASFFSKKEVIFSM
jgi:uncharacterized protein (DUF1015 family)